MEKAAGGGREAAHILLVDDEDMVRDIGVQMLKKLGYSVEGAANGRAALEIFRQRGDEIDIVILDVVMPDMDGGQLFDEIKRIKPDVKMLLSSGFGKTGKAAEIMERGCDGFIQKPFSLNEFSRAIRGILESG